MHRMSHPFEKLFEKALKKSSVDENMVLKEAQKLLEKGYRPEEICTVLKKLEGALIDDGEASIVREAREEVCGEEEDEDE
jgi:SOS response regulatory protein OraA/RecX